MIRMHGGSSADGGRRRDAHHRGNADEVADEMLHRGQAGSTAVFEIFRINAVKGASTMVQANDRYRRPDYRPAVCSAATRSACR